MIWLTVVIVLRLAAAGLFLVTAAYAVLNCSPFAFDTFIRPQLFPWLTRFVNWHHLWFCGAYVASVISLAPELRRRPGRTRPAAYWLALGFVICVGAVALRLVSSPYLPTLWNDRRALPTALAAFLPLLWLAVVDHASVRLDWSRSLDRRGTLDQRRLLATCAAGAAYVWSMHLLRAVVHGERTGSAAAWVLTALWALAQTTTIAAMVYTLMGLIAGVAARSRQPRLTEYALTVALAAIGVCEFLRRVVLPTVSLPVASAAAVAAVAGVTFAMMWSGFALRKAALRSSEVADTGSAVLLAPLTGHTTTVVALVVMPLLTAWALARVERMDWVFVAQRLIVVFAWVVAFGLLLRLTSRMREHTWSAGAALVPPAAALIALWAIPQGTSLLAASTGNHRLDPTVLFERYAAAETGFSLMADGLTTRAGVDLDYYRYLQMRADPTGSASVAVPDIEFSSHRAPASVSRPDIFLFVIDSLRPDYLSPYNAAVTFTPAIGTFAAESFVFRNVFTRHGGTELAMPSIWAGGSVVRKVLTSGFDRMNAMEKLINADGYRIEMNDFTVGGHLRPETPVTAIDTDLPNVQADLCHQLDTLEGHLDDAADSRPVFAYFSPMNVHILNTRRGGQESVDDEYRDFYSPYASRLQRLDGCFGRFVSFLKARQRFENSIIIITGDHGDSLGENGHWGHAMWLFPEDVRVPLIVHIPEALRPGLTTDLTRLTFTTDIAPTIYALRNHPVRDLGPLFGAPLFVPQGQTLADRRRESFLLTSSYGPTFGLLRRNGQFLYVTDLLEWRDFAYDLARAPAEQPMVIDRDLRSLNEREIRARLDDLASLYHITW